MMSSMYSKICDIWRTGKTEYSATKCSPKTESPVRRRLPNVGPEAAATGSRRRHVVACLYVGLCVAHGTPLLFTVFFAIVCTVVREDVLQATITFGSIQVVTDRSGLLLHRPHRQRRCET